jgi:DNA-binding response OmpR family regulator
MKVMIVDDQKDLRSLLSTTQDMGDFEILEADNGLSALELVAKNPPDVMILDISMPGAKDGFEVCKELKTNPATQGIFVIMLSGRSQNKDKLHGTEVGADEYLTKPFSPRALMDKVYDVLHL